MAERMQMQRGPTMTMTMTMTRYIVPVGLSVAAAFSISSPWAGEIREPAMQSRPFAEARMQPLDGSTLTGRFTFRHAGEFVLIEGTLNTLTRGKHGIHVHEGRSCENRGGHFNPARTRHGSPDQPHDMRHVGDLGNVIVGEDSTARYARIEALARLAGPHSIVDRVLVVHQGEDDYVTQPAGSSGREIACGVIRRAGAETTEAGR